MSDKPKICLKERSDGSHLGAVEMPIASGKIRVAMLGWDPMAALRRATSAAMQIATDPAIAPFLPPQVTMGVHAARALSKLSPEGLRTAAEEGSPATRKLAKVLLAKIRKQIEDEEASLGARTKAFRTNKQGETTWKYRPKARPGAKTSQGGRAPGTNRGTGVLRADFDPANPAATFGGTVVPVEQLRPGETVTPIGPYAQYQQQAPPVQYDQYGRPIGPPGQYGYPPPGGGGGGGGYMPQTPGDQAEAYAMQAWGPQAYDQPTDLQPDVQADEYFQAYEEEYYSDDADRLLEWDEEYGGEGGES